MSVRWEFAHAGRVSVQLLGPDEVFEESGERIDPNHLVLTVGYDEVFAIVGTPSELLGVAERIMSRAKKPLPPLPDGSTTCPKCGSDDLTLYEQEWQYRNLEWCSGRGGGECYASHPTGWHAGETNYGGDGGTDAYVACGNGHDFAVPSIEEWG